MTTVSPTPAARTRSSTSPGPILGTGTVASPSGARTPGAPSPSSRRLAWLVGHDARRSKMRSLAPAEGAVEIGEQPVSQTRALIADFRTSRRCGPTSTARPPGRRPALSRRSCSSGDLPADRPDRAARRLPRRPRLRRDGAGDLPRARAAGHGARLRRRRDRAGQPPQGRDEARACDADAARRHPRARRASGAAPGGCGAIGICIGGHLAFRAALHPEVLATACFYATDLHSGSLGLGKSDDTLGRAGEIRGELLMIWGRQDPHIPADGRALIHQRAARRRPALHLARVQRRAGAFMRDEGHGTTPRPTAHRVGWQLALLAARARRP